MIHPAPFHVLYHRHRVAMIDDFENIDDAKAFVVYTSDYNEGFVLGIYETATQTAWIQQYSIIAISATDLNNYIEERIEDFKSNNLPCVRIKTYEDVKEIQ